MTIIIFLIILSALIFVHEMGHLLAAKYFGIRVDEFGFGYPPRAKKLFTWRGTLFTLNWLPFGGFVKIFGENPNELAQSPDSFQNKNRGVQALVLAGGVIFNFVFAAILLAIAYKSVSLGLSNTFYFTYETIKAILDFSIENVAGPVGIVGIVGEAAKFGFSSLLILTALISINLSLINLLPLPALDGGRLLILLGEAISRRKIPAKIFNAVNTLGFAFLIFLMILITIRDVGKII